jgi:hypothetical protein
LLPSQAGGLELSVTLEAEAAVAVAPVWDVSFPTFPFEHATNKANVAATPSGAPKTFVRDKLTLVTVTSLRFEIREGSTLSSSAAFE